MFGIIGGALTSRLAGPIASVVALALAAALVFTTISAKATEAALSRQVGEIQASIDAPGTGWRARLAQCHENGDRLQAAIDVQNKQVEAWQAAAKAATDRAAALLAAAHVASANAAKSAVVTLSLKPGADHCASALDLIRSP